MSITTPLRRKQQQGWGETAAAALTVADVTSIHVRPETVRAVVRETVRAYGGPEGVKHELSRRLAGDKREADRTRRTLNWARELLRGVERDA